MASCLIIGYGNPLRSDDGFGWKAAIALEPQVSPADGHVIAAQQLTPELADAVSRASRVLFLDASHQGEPGEIRMQPVHRNASFQAAAISHHLSPADVLELAYRHCGAEPDATLLTVTGQNFALGEILSPPVEIAWKPCLERVLEWVRALESVRYPTNT